MKSALLSLFFVFLLLGGFSLFVKEGGGKKTETPHSLAVLAKAEESGDLAPVREPAGDPGGRFPPPGVSGDRRVRPFGPGALTPKEEAALPRLPVRGLVVDSKGRPLSGARIGFRFSRKKWSRGGKPGYHSLVLGRTGLGGGFDFLLRKDLVQRGKLTATHPDFVPKALAIALDPEGNPLPFLFKLDPGISFRFRLVDPKNRGLSRLVLYASPYQVPEEDAKPLGGLLLDDLGLGVKTVSGRSGPDGIVWIRHWPKGVPLVFRVAGLVHGLLIRSTEPGFETFRDPELPLKGVHAFLPRPGGEYRVTLVPDRRRLLHIEGRALGYTPEEISQIYAWADYRGSRPLIQLRWNGKTFVGTLNLVKASKRLKNFSILFRIRGPHNSWRLIKAFGPFDLKTTRYLPNLLLKKP